MSLKSELQPSSDDEKIFSESLFAGIFLKKYTDQTSLLSALKKELEKCWDLQEMISQGTEYRKVLKDFNSGWIDGLSEKDKDSLTIGLMCLGFEVEPILDTEFVSGKMINIINELWHLRLVGISSVHGEFEYYTFGSTLRMDVVQYGANIASETKSQDSLLDEKKNVESSENPFVKFISKNLSDKLDKL